MKKIYPESNDFPISHAPKNRFKKGDIVYWVYNDHRSKPRVEFGMVEDYYASIYYLRTFEYNVPKVVKIYDEKSGGYVFLCKLEDFETTDFFKLPKKWSYNIQLFTIEISSNMSYPLYVNTKDPEDIRRAINEKIIKPADEYTISIEENIRKGIFRLVRKSTRNYRANPTKDNIYVYSSFEECQEICDKIEAENERIANLSDYEFNLEDMNNKLDLIFRDDEVMKEKYRKYLMGKDNFEDMEFMISGRDLKWRYYKNKRWADVDLG